MEPARLNDPLAVYHAKALLIPLTDSIQDKARFPQKISEYLASGNPIITTNFGEVPFYFHDQKNALVANEYDINEYAGKFDFIVENPDISMQIGRNGKLTGLKFFDYNSYGVEIKKMIITIMEDSGLNRVKTGWFSNWYAAMKRDLGMA